MINVCHTGIKATTPVSTLNLCQDIFNCTYYTGNTAQPVESLLRSTPRTIPSRRNGARTNASVAPMYFIIPISSLRTEIPTETVLLIRKIEMIRRSCNDRDRCIGNQLVKASQCICRLLRLLNLSHMLQPLNIGILTLSVSRSGSGIHDSWQN